MKRINKLISSFNTLSIIDFLRWLILTLRYTLIKRSSKTKSLFYFKRLDVKIGRNVQFKGISLNINIEDDLEIYDNCIIEFGNNSHLSIGKSCLFSYGVIIQNNLSISIGNFVQIGEYTSIRDTTHQYNQRDIPFKKQKDLSADINIGSNVWIGKCCIIMPGTIIEDNVIIGANSVVKGTLKSGYIYAGTPLKQIKKIV